MEECGLCGQVEWEHLDPAGEEYCRGLHNPEVFCTMCPTEEDLKRMRPEQEDTSSFMLGFIRRRNKNE